MSAVLVIDDDPSVRTLLTVALELDGHRVQGVAMGSAGLATLRRPGRERQTVILDVHMPELDGWGVLTEIRADDLLCDVPVILCTAMASTRDLARGWAAGCDAYVTKPFDITALCSEVARLAALSPDEVVRRRVERRHAG